MVHNIQYISQYKNMPNPDERRCSSLKEIQIVEVYEHIIWQ